MSLFERLRRIARRSAVTPAVSASAPEPAPDAAAEAEGQRLVQSIEEIRRSTADAMASRRKLETQADELRLAVEKLQVQAAAAAAKHQDELARAALRESLAVERRLAERQKVIDQLRAHEHELAESSAKLQTRVADDRARLEAARARASAAQAAQTAQTAQTDDGLEASALDNPPPG
jgi:phage shock protein A